MKAFFRWLDRKITEAKTTTPLCELSKGSILYPSARIFNIFGKSDRIKIGANTFVRGEITTFAHGGDIKIGEYCYIGEGTRIWSAKKIIIGNRVLISHNVNIFDNDTHPIDDHHARHEQFRAIVKSGHPRKIDLKEEEIIIGDDVLISCNCIILKGVTIGNGAIIGAGSVVCHDVAPFTIVAGNPAKQVRTLREVNS